MDPKAPYADCDRCPLKDKHFVPGHGRRQAGRVIVGLAPGDKEVREGRPFVGLAGGRLNEALMAKGADRSRIYITNTVLCGPPNHKPPPEAVSACFKRLIQEVQGAMPRRVLALGEIAGHALTGDRGLVREMRLRRYTFPGLGDCELRVTYHPAARPWTSELARCFEEDIGFLGEDLVPTSRADMCDLFEQGYSAYEIGRIFLINEARIRRMLQDCASQ
jgi:DNA polymerase